jgi:hypothetical protein
LFEIWNVSECELPSLIVKTEVPDPVESLKATVGDDPVQLVFRTVGDPILLFDEGE